jgi:hypothetical protein
MNLFRSKIETDMDLSAKALYTAVENVRDMGLGVRHADDTEYQDRLNDIAGDLAFEGETVLMKTATDKGLYFFPKFLNDNLKDYPELPAQSSFVPSIVRSHGQ